LKTNKAENIIYKQTTQPMLFHAVFAYPRLALLGFQHQAAPAVPGASQFM
jgi:hypothetical protein